MTPTMEHFGSNRVPWTDYTDKSQIVMIGVRFTNSRRISGKELIDELRERYKVIDDKDEESE